MNHVEVEVVGAAPVPGGQVGDAVGLALDPVVDPGQLDAAVIELVAGDLPAGDVDLPPHQRGGQVALHDPDQLGEPVLRGDRRDPGLGEVAADAAVGFVGVDRVGRVDG